MKQEGITLLVAEDQASIRNLMGSILEKEGYRVVTALDGLEAVKLYKENPALNCVISDILMPGMDGREFARYNYDNRLLPFIICTSMTDAKVALDLLKFGVHDYVVKPFTPKELLAVVSVVVNKNKSEKPTKCAGSIYPWQVETISFLSHRKEVHGVTLWVMEKLESVLEKRESVRFINFLSEFILNAIEHGNLNIGEREKHDLIVKGTFEEELSRRESQTSKAIQISIAKNNKEVAVKITDEGKGFPYNKYLDMDEESFIKRMSMPNGRGIFMGKNYFDRVVYEDGGASVIVVKKIGQRGNDCSCKL